MEERRYLPSNTTIDERGGAPRIVGYAAVFDSFSEEMPLKRDDPNSKRFREIIRPGAFASSLIGQRAIFANFQHNQTAILGSTANGTLRLSEDFRGLRYEIDPPNTTAGRDAVELIRRGDVRMSSFGFNVPTGGDSWKRDGGQLVRELRKVVLLDISPVTVGAYAATDAAVRSFEGWVKAKTLREMRLELAEAV